jgi:hypothetical protein
MLMPRRLLACLVAACAAFALLAPAALAEPLFPRGSRVGLEPPGNLKPSSRFAGFEDADRKVAISILDLPGADYAELERAANAKSQAGFGEIKREEFTFQSGKGLLITGRVKVAGAMLRKWALLATAADQDLTTLINVEVPEAALNVYPEAAVRKALASVTFRPPPIQEQLGLLPFKLGDLAGFRVTKVFPGGAVLVDGAGEDLSKQPCVIVSVGRGAPEQADDRARFARDLLSSAPLRDLQLRSADAMRINGAPGYEIRAQAQGPQGEPVMVAQWLRFAGDGFVRVVGIGRQQDWDALFTRFRAVRDGIELR